jgi:hypothetical protein
VSIFWALVLSLGCFVVGYLVAVVQANHVINQIVDDSEIRETWRALR